jgi:hypothetical protein
LRAYSSIVVANALGVGRRWLDGVVVQNPIEGVIRERQGVSRTISPNAVVTIAVALVLIDALHIPVASALALAAALIREGGEHAPAPGVRLRVDLSAIEQRVSKRLTEAVESHPPARRGRRPRPR